MTKNTYSKIVEMGKEYLVEFIMKIENIPSIGLKPGTDLTVDDISKIEELYCFNRNK